MFLKENNGDMGLLIKKENLRKSVYDNLFDGGFSNRVNGDYGKIPDFKGSNLAAELLASNDEWKSSKTIFCSPDSAQIPVRYIALKENKNIIMASPNLEHGYLFLEGNKLTGHEIEASTKEGAFDYCSGYFDISFDDGVNLAFDCGFDNGVNLAFDCGFDNGVNLAIDMVIEGSVAVDKSGNRIGKGKGFGDREIDDLLNRSLIDEDTPLVTTIHPLQLVDSVPMGSHDKKLNMIVTLSEIIRIDL